jgi:predicted PurR-regulated permease PerM
MDLEIYLLILGIAFFLLIIFCIPILLQIWLTTKNITLTLDTLNRSLPIILNNLEEITTNINNSTTVVNREIQTISDTVRRFHSGIYGIFGDIQSLLPKAVNLPLFRIIKNATAIIKGVRVFLNVFLNKR